MAKLLNKKRFTDLFCRLLHKEFIAPRPNRQVNIVADYLGSRNHLNGYFNFFLKMEFGINCYSVYLVQEVYDNGEKSPHDKIIFGRLTFDLPKDPNTFTTDLESQYKRFKMANQAELKRYDY